MRKLILIAGDILSFHQKISSSRVKQEDYLDQHRYAMTRRIGEDGNLSTLDHSHIPGLTRPFFWYECDGGSSVVALFRRPQVLTEKDYLYYLKQLEIKNRGLLTFKR